MIGTHLFAVVQFARRECRTETSVTRQVLASEREVRCGRRLCVDRRLMRNVRLRLRYVFCLVCANVQSIDRYCIVVGIVWLLHMIIVGRIDTGVVEYHDWCAHLGQVGHGIVVDDRFDVFVLVFVIHRMRMRIVAAMFDIKIDHGHLQ